MERQYGMIQLKTSFPADFSDLRTMSQFGQELCLAFSNRKIIKCKLSKTFPFTVEERKELIIGAEGHEICQMEQFLDQLLIQLQSKTDPNKILCAFATNGSIKKYFFKV